MDIARTNIYSWIAGYNPYQKPVSAKTEQEKMIPPISNIETKHRELSKDAKQAKGKDYFPKKGKLLDYERRVDYET